MHECFMSRLLSKLTILFLLFISGSMLAQEFNGFISYVNSLPVDQRSEKTDSLMENTDLFPITEDGFANFIYNGSGANAQIAGDFTGWNPSNGPMTNVSGTQFWYLTVPFENAARVDYKIVTNGSTWILDPLNPFTAPGGFGSNSELRMPDYIPPAEIIYDPSIPHGTLESTSFFSVNMNDSRTIQIYLPPGYAQSTQDYPMVLVHDGSEYLSFAEMDNTLDYLIHNGSIPPVIAVFVPPVDRTEEYHESEQDDFTNFIAVELMSWLHEEYRILSDPEQNAVIGSSSGGNISIWLGMVHPEVFGNVGAFSPYVEPEIISTFENAVDLADLKVYMNHGVYDHIQTIHQSVAAFEPILDDGGYEYLYELYPESHSYGFWRAHVDDALIYFFGESTGLEDYQAELELNISNAPNPFTEHTEISFNLARSSNVLVQVMDSKGELVDTLLDERMESGTNEIMWDSRSSEGLQLSSGLYYVCVSLRGSRVACRKMVLSR